MHQGRVSLCRIYMKFDLSVSVYDGLYYEVMFYFQNLRNFPKIFESNSKTYYKQLARNMARKLQTISHFIPLS